jgi:hypothetical protein
MKKYGSIMCVEHLTHLSIKFEYLNTPLVYIIDCFDFIRINLLCSYLMCVDE